MREALDLIVSTLEDQIGRARARVGSLVASAAADAQALAERNKQNGADAVDSALLAMHVRELAAAQAELADRREWLCELQSVVDFAARAPVDRNARP